MENDYDCDCENCLYHYDKLFEKDCESCNNGSNSLDFDKFNEDMDESHKPKKRG